MNDLLARTVYHIQNGDELRTQAYKKAQIQKIKTKLKDPKNYLAYGIENGVVTKLVLAHIHDNPLEGKGIKLLCFKIPGYGKVEVKKEIIKLRDYFKKKSLFLFINATQDEPQLYRTLMSLRFCIIGRYFEGDLEKSLTQIKKYPEYQIENLEMSDFNEALRLELRAHRHEPTSVVHKIKKKNWNFFAEHVKTLVPKKQVFIIKERKKIIGLICYTKREGSKASVMVSSIAVHPQYKGLGISKALYVGLLRELKKRRISKYYGYSNTKQVIKSAKKMERTISVSTFKLDKDLLYKT